MLTLKFSALLILANICLAHRSSKMEKKIVGGKEVRIRAYPHSMFLSMYCGAGKWICGSSVLNNKMFLTAAHCLEGCRNLKYWSIEAFAGHEDLRKTAVLRKVKKFLVHPDYNDKTVINDIAIGILNKALPLGPTIKTVLITEKFPDMDRDPYVAGWGIVNDRTFEESMVLKALSQKMRPRRTCQRIGRLHPGMMCAGNPDKNVDRPSRGDSGSALVYKSVHQIGLVSFMVDDYRSMPVYTNVSYYYHWIQATTKSMYIL